MAGTAQNLVGKRVQKLRIEADLTQDSLVARCQIAGWYVSRGTFAKIEAGLRRVNDAEVVILAQVLKCKLDDLLGGLPAKTVKAVIRNGKAG